MPRVVPCKQCGALVGVHTFCPRCQKDKDQANPYQQQPWRKQSAAVKRRDGGTCVYCGSDDRVSAHHIFGRAQGGSDDAANLISLCVSCHGQIEADKRAGKRTDLVVFVEQLGTVLALSNGPDDVVPF